MAGINFWDGDAIITYLVWVLLWINAIKDSYLWMDSPDCFFFKVDYIQWNHDLTSRLRRANWEHKILSTISTADNVIWNRNDDFIKSLKSMVEKDFVKQVFVSSMPMSQIVWTDYEWVINEVKIQTNSSKPIFHIPSRSMTDCWLEWYADLLFSLAKNIDITWASSQKNNVAIVWNLFDRGEWDCMGNIHELRRIIEWLWLNVVSIWLDWWNYDDILKIKDAETILSLPYWRKAAKKIAQRLWVDVLELDLPFWLDKTWEFIREIGKYFWKEKVAEEFIKKELKEFNKIDIIKWIVPHTFFWKKISFHGDPYLLNGIIDLSKTMWFQLGKVFIHGDEKHIKNNKEISLDGIDYTFGFKQDLLDWDIDILITNSHVTLRKELKLIMQFWFPSYDYHIYTYEPYFGYKWALSFLNRIWNTLNMNNIHNYI